MHSNETTTLRGVLEKRVYFGPPNYGETPEEDAKETALILKLDAPIDVSGVSLGGDSTLTDQSEIQLIYPHPLEDGACFTVTGALFEGHTGHHITDVLMDVTAVEKC